MKKLIFAFLLTLMAIPAINAEEAPAGKLSGLVYFDYFHNVGRDTGISSISNKMLDGAKDFYGFQLRRVFFTYDYNISKKLTSRFRMEVDQKALSSDGKISNFIKDAYLKWKDVFDGSDIVVGLQPTLGYETQENIWQYRSLERVIFDIRGFTDTRDLGISLKGKIDKGGMFNYGIQYGNASSVKPETDKFKRVSAMLNIIPMEKFNVLLYGELKMKAAIKDKYSTTGAMVNNDDMAFNFSVGYKEPDKFAFGADVIMRMSSNAADLVADKKLGTLTAFGFSVYGNYFFMPELGIVARFDNYDPNNLSDAKADSRMFILGGLDWKVTPNFSIIPNVEYESYEKIEAVGVFPEKTFDPSMTARITFFYKF